MSSPELGGSNDRLPLRAHCADAKPGLYDPVAPRTRGTAMTNGRQPVSDPSSFATSTERHLADIVDAPLNLHEYDAAARAALPTMIYDYIARGAGDEVTLRRPPSAAGWRAARLSQSIQPLAAEPWLALCSERCCCVCWTIPC
jgi:hypothetical protein